MLRSTGSPSVTLTTRSNKKAFPCWPRKFYLSVSKHNVSLGEARDEHG